MQDPENQIPFTFVKQLEHTTICVIAIQCIYAEQKNKAHTKNITHLLKHPYIVSIDEIFFSYSIPFSYGDLRLETVLIFDVTFI